MGRCRASELSLERCDRPRVILLGHVVIGDGRFKGPCRTALQCIEVGVAHALRCCGIEAALGKAGNLVESCLLGRWVGQLVGILAPVEDLKGLAVREEDLVERLDLERGVRILLQISLEGCGLSCRSRCSHACLVGVVLLLRQLDLTGRSGGILCHCDRGEGHCAGSCEQRCKYDLVHNVLLSFSN